MTSMGLRMLNYRYVPGRNPSEGFFFFFFCKVFLPLFKRTEENLTALTWAGCCMFLACFFRVTVLQTFKIRVFFSR